MRNRSETRSAGILGTETEIDLQNAVSLPRIPYNAAYSDFPMSLAVGAHLGNYEVAGLLGKGSMGEVYRAKDRVICAIRGPGRAASEHDKIVDMIPSISHDRNEETPEAKARWFQSLPLSERMELLCTFTDLAFSNNPNIADSKDAQSTSRRVLVLSETRR
jgi:serine/threonine protein kinase